jgi:hypothetical protein
MRTAFLLGMLALAIGQAEASESCFYATTGRMCATSEAACDELRRQEVTRLDESSVTACQPYPSPKPAARKDPRFAAAWSWIPTLAGAAMIATGVALLGPDTGGTPTTTTLIVGGTAGIVVGPTLGHVYAEHTWSAGLALRVIGLPVGFASGLALAGCGVGGRCPGAAAVAAAIGFLGGAGAYVFGTGYELVTAPAAARDFNHAHHLDTTIAPVPITTSSGVCPGISLVGQF